MFLRVLFGFIYMNYFDKVSPVKTSDICIKTQFKNTLNNYTKSDILTKRLVLLPVDWDANSLLCIYEAAPCDE